MKKSLFLVVAVAAVAFLSGGVAHANDVQVAPCPQIGDANGCNVVITINPGPVAGILVSHNPPYDGVEDQLVGVINNSGGTLGSLGLSGPFIFGFDGDGAGDNTTFGPFTCHLGTPGLYGCPFSTPGPTGYEGLGSAGQAEGFVITDVSNGFVNFFGGGIPNGGTAWFSLEQAPSVTGITITQINPNPVPEPGTLLTLVVGLLGLGGFARRRLSL